LEERHIRFSVAVEVGGHGHVQAFRAESFLERAAAR
jgi:hypothetical protein